MGIWGRIKSWFGSRFKRSSDMAPKKLEPKAKSEWQTLNEEYGTLSDERETLRDQLTELDVKLAGGQIDTKQRDKEYRLKLSRAAFIARRLNEIRSRAAELGRPIA
ncbi:MAG: hypothetical protein ACFE7E_00545 [Candidatus Hodarchaeota archaeon]